MRTFVYRARFEPGEKPGVIVVSFPDVPEAITEGKGEADAITQAQGALGVALLTYPDRHLPLPKPKARGGDLGATAVQAATAPKHAAKLSTLTQARGVLEQRLIVSVEPADCRGENINDA